MATHPKPAGHNVLNELKRTAAKKSIMPVLSPLEKAVFNQAGQPFNFRYNGVKIYISSQACKQLLVAVIDKLRLLTLLVENEKTRAHIPFKLREVVDDPREILALSPRLRNQLCALECYTLFAISKKGRRFFTKQKFSKHSLQIIEGLFAKYGCTNLFI